MATKMAIPGFSQYSFFFEGEKLVEVKNSKDKAVEPKDGKYRLTDDAGKRVTKTAEDLKPYTAEGGFPDNLDNVQSEVHEEKLPVIEGEVGQHKEEKAVEAPKPATTPRKRKLSFEIATSVRERLAKGEKEAAIAKELDVHQSTIADIKAGRLYPTEEQKAAAKAKKDAAMGKPVETPAVAPQAEGAAGPALTQTETTNP